MQMANKHIKRCLTPLIIREMQVQITVRHNFMAITKTKQANK